MGCCAIGRIALCGGLLLWAAVSASAQKPDPKTMRLYTNGPLTPEDYQPKPSDAPKDFGARTDSQLRYHAEFEFLVGAGTVTCQATSITIYAVLHPKTTWADPQRIEELLDHEQGHFDITQKHALMASESLLPKVKRRLLKASGPTAERAREALARRIDAEIKRFADRGVAENEAYDEATRHGTLPQAQTEWRERQKQELSDLQEETSRRSAAPRTQRNGASATRPGSAP